MEFQPLISQSIDMFNLIWPIAVPIALGFMLFKLWVDFAQKRFDANTEKVLLRIIPPKEITKTPAAMELFLQSLYQTGGEATALDKYWRGKSRAKFTLEIASIGGDVGFYIWCRTALRSYIEGQIYAQYPGIEVMEVEDYSNLDYDSGNYNAFGVEYALTKPDPLPIKTYIDYGADKITEEYEKIDPITATLEFMGGLKAGENAWLQIHVKAHKEKPDPWIEEAKEMVAEIKKEGLYKDEKDPDSRPINFQTKAQEEKINAIERNISKLGFDVGIRGVYIAEKDAFTGSNIGGLIGSFRQYGSPNLNGFKPGQYTSFDYWWQDPSGKRVDNMKRQILNDYKNRVYFGTKLDRKWRKSYILNTEELATIFHFPGGVASTPTLTRIQSRKGEAPTNLPM